MTDITPVEQIWTFTLQETRNIVYEVSAKDLDYPQNSKEAAQAFYDFDITSGAVDFFIGTASFKYRTFEIEAL